MTLTVRPFGAAMRMCLLLLGLIAVSSSANAACANPVGNAGDMTYSTSANVMAYCDSNNWVSMAGGVSLTVNTSGGGATPAGSSADVQFNSSGALAADTGNFIYSSGLLKAPNISTTAITASGAGNFGTINSSGLGTLGSLIVTGGATITGQASVTTISTSLIQVGNNGASCTSSLAGGVRFNSTSNTIDYCTGTSWTSLASGTTASAAFSDRITSGTVSVTTNPSGYVSLSTAGSTWGYLSSAATFLPQINANTISSTLVSASTVSTTYVQIQSASTVLACGSGLAGAMRYTSGTLQVCDGSNWGNVGIGVPTGTIAAFATASCPSGWSEYTAARGRFLRGIDNGAGIDPGGTRSPGSTQSDMVGPITYTFTTGWASNFNSGQTGTAGVTAAAAPSGNGTKMTGNVTGNNGTETRPANVAVTFCQYNGFQSQLQTGVATLVSLSDVSVAGASTGQVLTYSGGTWIASTTTASAAQGDRITSGTLSIIANTGSAYVSLTTNGTTWGYLSSNASYIPTLQTGFENNGTISTTLIQTGANSVTCSSGLYGSIRWNATSDTIQICNSAGWISLASSSVPNNVTGSGQNNYAAIFSGSNTLVTDTALYVDRTLHNVAIGSTMASATLTVSGSGVLVGVSNSLYQPNGRTVQISTQTGNARLVFDGASGGNAVFTVASNGSILNVGTLPANISLLAMTSASSVGIGTSAPTASLTVIGEVQVGNSGATCVTATNAGAIRYSAGTLYYCNGSNTWSAISGGGGGFTGGGSATAIAIWNGANSLTYESATTSGLYWDSINKRLGIGTNSPTASIEISSTGSMWIRKGAGGPLPSSAGAGLKLESSANGAYVQGYDYTGGAATSLLLNGSGGNVGVGLGSSPTATLQVSGTFTVSNSSQITTPSLFVNSTGNVGIGKNNPQSSRVLDVSGSSLFTFITISDSAAGLQIADRGSGRLWQIYSANNKLGLFDHAVPALRTVLLDANGNMGISNTSPVAKLDVNGTISASDAIQVGSSNLACSNGVSGSLRYSTTSSTIEYCNSTAWTSLGPSSTQPVSFYAHNNGANETVPTGTDTKLTFSTIAFDTNNNFSTATSRFTPTMPGKYLILIGIRCTNSTSSCAPKIYKNGAAYFTGVDSISNGNHGTQIMGIVDMNGTTDYVEAYAYVTGTAVSGAKTDLFFQGVILSPQSGAGGSSPAGTTGDVQYNNAGALAADTGNFTYANSVLSVRAVSATNISGTLIQAGQSAATCAAGINGAIRYNSTSNTIDVCVGSAWASLSSGTTASTALGDRITSGTVSVTTNPSGYVSLSTAGSTWGYLGSAATFLPQINANAVSSTLVSASTISTTYVQIQSATTVLACGSGFAGTMRYTSGTMQVCDGSNWTNVGIGIPTGTIAAFATTSCPNGWSEYTSARGRFLRGIDNGAGVDPSGTRVPGSTQGDTQQEITGSFQALAWNLGGPTNAFTSSVNTTNTFQGGTSTNANQDTFNFKASNVVRTSTEVRPANVAVIFCQYQGYQSQLATGVATLASLTDVSIGGKVSGSVLTYNGSSWIAGSAAAAGSSGDIQFNNGGVLAADTGNLFWDSTNHRLGIGTASPVAALDISGSNNSTSFRLSTTATDHSPYMGWYAGGVRQAYMGYGVPGSVFSLTMENANALSILSSITTVNGAFGIGTSGNPSFKLEVVSNTAGAAVAKFTNGTGGCTFTPAASGSGTWSCSSDARLKKDIVDTHINALNYFGRLRIRDYTMKSDNSRQTGVIAQEVMLMHPEMVHTGNDGLYTVDEPNKWMLVRAIQEIAGLSGIFRHALVTWFASAENGIHDFFVDHLHADDVHAAKMICVGGASDETCLTKADVQELLKVKAANDNLMRRLDALEKRAVGR